MGEMFNLRVFKTMTNGFLSVYNDSLNKMIWIPLTCDRFELHLTYICMESCNLSLLSKICSLRKVTKRYRVLTQCRVYGVNSRCGVQVLLLSPVAGLTMQQLRVQMEFSIYQNKKWLQCTNTQQADWRLSILIQPINDYFTYNVLIIVHH